MVSGFKDQFHFLSRSAVLFLTLFCSIVPVSVITLEGSSQPKNTVQPVKVYQGVKEVAVIIDQGNRDPLYSFRVVSHKSRFVR